MSEGNYNENQGTLNKVKPEDLTESWHAPYRGKATVEGVEYWLNGYVRDAPDGTKFISFKLKPKQAKPADAPPAAAPAAGEPAADEEIPF